MWIDLGNYFIKTSLIQSISIASHFKDKDIDVKRTMKSKWAVVVNTHDDSFVLEICVSEKDAIEVAKRFIKIIETGGSHSSDISTFVNSNKIYKQLKQERKDIKKLFLSKTVKDKS